MSKPVDVSQLKIGHYVIIDDEPCRIVEYEKSKPGKHGAAKARIVAMSIFTGNKKSVVSPVSGRLDVPMVEKRAGQVLALMDQNVQLMDMETYETLETPLPDDEDIRNRIAPGKEVEFWRILGRNMIVRVKS
ncbi:MAG: translation initiation factor IF-5A [archaeon]